MAQTYPGSDGLVRVVDVFDGNSTLRRAVQRLTLLLKNSDSNTDSQNIATSGSGFLAPEDVRA